MEWLWDPKRGRHHVFKELPLVLYQSQNIRVYGLCANMITMLHSVLPTLFWRSVSDLPPTVYNLCIRLFAHLYRYFLFTNFSLSPRPLLTLDSGWLDFTGRFRRRHGGRHLGTICFTWDTSKPLRNLNETGSPAIYWVVLAMLEYIWWRVLYNALTIYLSPSSMVECI